MDIDALTNGQAAAALNAFTPEQVADRLELPPELLQGKLPAVYIRELARDFASHRPAIALGGDSAGAHSNGAFNLQAIYALNYLVGSVGQPGGLRFNPGQSDPGIAGRRCRRLFVRLAECHRPNPQRRYPAGNGA